MPQPHEDGSPEDRSTASPQPPMSTPMDEAVIAKRTRRSFVGAALAAGAGVAGWRWLRTRSDADGVPWPLRKTLEANERVTRRLVDDAHLTPEKQFGSVPPNPRVNGDLGLTSGIDLNAWRLHVSGLNVGNGSASFTLDQVKDFEPVNVAMRLCCIEGWSIMVNWTGTRFSDFFDRYKPALRTDGRPFDYVAMSTPDGEYYVGLDIASVLHPQTLLCYAIDGRPLTAEHGAPLRLVIPTKYGVKNIKRIGKIDYTEKRPPDYWAEQGYDWFAGL